MNSKLIAARRNYLPTGLLLGAAAVGFALNLRADYATDFNSGTAPGWKTFDVTELLNSLGVPGTYATYTFPPDGNGGKGYRIDSFANPVPGDAGPGRAFSYRPEVYTRGVFTVDVLDWTSIPDVAYGILFRANTIGPGSTAGYIMNYNTIDEVLQFNPVESEAAGATGAEVSVLLDPVAHDYRWELSTWGPNMVGRVFQLPDTDNPIASVVATDSTTDSGVTGLFNFDQDGAAPAGELVASTTFDNFVALVPPAGSLAPVVVELSPTPAAGVHVPKPVFRVAVLDRDTTVKADSFELKVDGVPIPPAGFSVTPSVTVPNNADPFPGATLTYTPPSTLVSGLHTASVVFADNTGAKQTNAWSFTADYFTGSAAVGGLRGFNVRLTQAAKQDAELGNSLQRAFLQLAPDSPITPAYTTNVVSETINYSQKAVDDPPGTDGSFEGDQPFPGQTPGGPTDNYAMEVTCWLDLPAGTTTFGVISDDGFQLTSAALAASPILGRVNGGTANVQFSAYTEVAGLYPFTLVWYENGGGAHLEWFVVKENGDKILLNTAGAPAAYTSAVTVNPNITLLSASTLGGTYVDAGLYVVDLVNKTIALDAPAAGATFYRVSAGVGPVTIKSIVVSGNQITIQYE